MGYARKLYCLYDESIDSFLEKIKLSKGVIAQKVQDREGEEPAGFLSIFGEHARTGLCVTEDMHLAHPVKFRAFIDANTNALVAHEAQGEPWSIAFYEYGSLAWMYHSSKDYPRETSDEICQELTGSQAGEILAKRSRIEPFRIKNYFMDWQYFRSQNDLGDFRLKGKAYETDNSNYGDASQVCDLIEALGFKEPLYPCVYVK
jgi:hypothetical protein